MAENSQQARKPNTKAADRNTGRIDRLTLFQIFSSVLAESLVWKEMIWLIKATISSWQECCFASIFFLQALSSRLSTCFPRELSMMQGCNSINLFISTRTPRWWFFQAKISGARLFWSVVSLGSTLRRYVKTIVDCVRAGGRRCQKPNNHPWQLI